MFSTIFLVLILSLLHENNVEAANFTCQNGEFVGFNEICNGIADCNDSSDERKELCLSTICQSNQFKCYYGACVDRTKICNKFNDCLDGSDEFNCGRSTESCE